MRRLATLLLLLGVACNGGEREGLTADSAVLQSPGGGMDSAPPMTGVGNDSASGDSAVTDSLPLINPTIVLAADSAAGDILFRRKGKCLSCHGLSGKGIDPLGPNLQDSVWLHGDGSFAFIRRIIVEGVARPKIASIAMPSFAPATSDDPSILSTALLPEEIYRIAAYVYTLSHPGSAVADTVTTVQDTLPVLFDTLAPPPIPVNPPPAQIPDTAAVTQASGPPKSSPAQVPDTAALPPAGAPARPDTPTRR